MPIYGFFEDHVYLWNVTVVLILGSYVSGSVQFARSTPIGEGGQINFFFKKKSLGFDLLLLVNKPPFGTD